MTIEQLLCPAVMMWEYNFRQKLNESHIEMSDDEIADEFDKWLAENEDLINKSVEDNIEHINETIERNQKKVLALNEGLFDDDAFSEDADEKIISDEDEETEDEPLTGEVEGEKTDPNEPEEVRSLTGVVKRPTLGYRTLSDNVWEFNNLLQQILMLPVKLYKKLN